MILTIGVNFKQAKENEYCVVPSTCKLSLYKSELPGTRRRRRRRRLLHKLVFAISQTN